MSKKTLIAVLVITAVFAGSVSALACGSKKTEDLPPATEEGTQTETQTPAS
ncbi:MAG: hypothetical protein ACOY3K_02865 [Candidatus Omnitrophota bacterium]